MATLGMLVGHGDVLAPRWVTISQACSPFSEHNLKASHPHLEMTTHSGPRYLGN